MKVGLKLLLVLALQVSCLLAEQFSFEGYKVVSLIPSDEKHHEMIENLQNQPDFDVLSHNHGKNVNTPVFVLLSSDAFEKYSRIFNKHNLEFTVINENFQNSVEAERRSMETPYKRDARNIVGKFARYSEINNFVESVADDLNNPPSMSSFTYIAGTTYENRIIKALVIKASTASRGIFIDCGIHAREWIAVSSCVYFIDQLRQGWLDSDSKWLRILNHYEIHIIPLMNPDGYEHSHESFRMWRKNRSPNSGSACNGTDLNRNFGYMWMTGGSSSAPCSDIYAGSSANSELETKALIKSINAKLGYWDAYLTVHTYGNYWLSSWSYTNTEFPDDLQELIAKSRIGADAMQEVANSKIITGNSGLLFGRLSGVSDDWAKGDALIKYSYTLELAPGSTDSDYSFGFALPEDRAPRVGKELTEGFKAFLNAIF